jgi:predicted nucleotide-binding protein
MAEPTTVMDKFTGTLDQLKEKVRACGVEGDWAEIANGYQLRCKDGSMLNWFSKTGTIQYQGVKEASQRLKVLLAGQPALQVDKPPAATAPVVRIPVEKPKVFVVHGHDTVAREQLELVLHRLGLEPFVLANTGGGGMTIIEALEQEIVKPHIRARFGIVLLTPDDMGWAQREGESAHLPRARQNVVLEMGMVLAALGRQNVAILKKGHIETPSDAQGIIYLPFNDHVKETVPKLVDRLRHGASHLSRTR